MKDIAFQVFHQNSNHFAFNVEKLSMMLLRSIWLSTWLGRFELPSAHISSRIWQDQFESL